MYFLSTVDKKILKGKSNIFKQNYMYTFHKLVHNIN